MRTEDNDEALRATLVTAGLGHLCRSHDEAAGASRVRGIRKEADGWRVMLSEVIPNHSGPVHSTRKRTLTEAVEALTSGLGAAKRVNAAPEPPPESPPLSSPAHVGASDPRVIEQRCRRACVRRRHFARARPCPLLAR